MAAGVGGLARKRVSSGLPARVLSDLETNIVVRLVSKLVSGLVSGKCQKRDKIRYYQQRKRLKKQHEQKLNCPHNPKVGGSNPSPAIS